MECTVFDLWTAAATVGTRAPIVTAAPIRMHFGHKQALYRSLFLSLPLIPSARAKGSEGERVVEASALTAEKSGNERKASAFFSIISLDLDRE